MRPQPMVSEQECTRCRLTKPASDFYYVPTAAKGLKKQCKACMLVRKQGNRAGLPNPDPKPNPDSNPDSDLNFDLELDPNWESDSAGNPSHELQRHASSRC